MIINSKYIILIYLSISIPRFVLYFSLNEFYPFKIFLELIFFLLVINISSLGNFKVTRSKNPEWISLLLISCFYVIAMSLGIDILKRIILMAFLYLFLKYTYKYLIAYIISLTCILSLIFSDSSNSGLFYGDTIFTRIIIEFGQNFTAWILFLLVVYRNFFARYYRLIALFAILELVTLSYYISDIEYFHIQYVDNYSDFNIIEKNLYLIMSKFIMRADWMWGIKNIGLDTPSLANIIYNNFNFSDSILRYLSPLQFPFAYYFDLQLWQPWEIADYLSKYVRGFGSYNLDASTWFYFAIANTFEGCLFLIFFLIVILSGIYLIKNNKITNIISIDFSLIFRLLFLSISMSISYIDRDLKIIFLISLAAIFLQLVPSKHVR